MRYGVTGRRKKPSATLGERTDETMMDLRPMVDSQIRRKLSVLSRGGANETDRLIVDSGCHGSGSSRERRASSRLANNTEARTDARQELPTA